MIPEKRSAGVAKLLADATTALGRERSWSRVEVGVRISPLGAQPEILSGNGFIEVAHDFNSAMRADRNRNDVAD